MSTSKQHIHRMNFILVYSLPHPSTRFPSLPTQNSSHDLFNSYFKTDGGPNSQDYCGQDLSVPSGSGGHGHDMHHQHGEQDLGTTSAGDQGMQLATDSDFGGAGALPHDMRPHDMRPHDMRVSSASSSAHEEHPQDLHLTGMIH